MPPRRTGSASSAQPADRQPLAQVADLVEVGAGVDERAERHVAGDAGEAVEPGDGASTRRPGQARSVTGTPAVDDRQREGRATAQAAPKPLSMPTTVMPDAHRRQHGQQRGDAFERGAVADAGRHGDDRRAGEAADDAGQRALHAGDDDDRVGGGQLVGGVEQAVQAGHADVGDAQRAGTRGRASTAAHSSATGRSAVPAVTTTTRSARSGAGRHTTVVAVARARRGWPPGAAVGLRVVGPGQEHRRRAAAASSSATMAAHCSGALPGP